MLAAAGKWDSMVNRSLYSASAA